MYGQMPLVVGPSIEGPGGAGFLTEDPTKMLKEHRVINKVPFISGIVPDEGQVFNLGEVFCFFFFATS